MVLSRRGGEGRAPVAAGLLCAAAGLLLLRPAPADAGAAHESTGWRPTAIPLLNFSSDDGTGYGLRANLYEYDGRTVPYRRKYSAQLFFTTGGKWVHRLLMDTPRFRGGGDRLEVELVYEKEEFANYYGGLSKAETRGLDRGQRTFTQAFPELKVRWIRPLGSAGGPTPWRLRLGSRLSYHEITPNADAGNILAEQDPLGADGGPLAQASAALRYDTRDNYNDSSAGLLEELVVQYTLGAGGDYNGLQARLEHRHFASLLPGLVAAHRIALDWTAGDLPFYEELALGGSSTVRGLPKARDRGETRVLLNGELRWRGVRLSSAQNIHLGGLLFADAGQIFAGGEWPAGGDWRRGAGLGLRFLWQSTIVRADHGFSGGGSGLYITFSQLF
ncbi:MAG: BamA/TamA family outer membrane protein [Gemmatimonadaceae bacterium]|nr:BamA/TamA family outer membrane protein [Gemmatimonadaceae bacterium]